VEANYTRFIIPYSGGENLAGQSVDGVVPKTYGASAKVQIPLSGPFRSIDFTASYFGSPRPLTDALTSAVPPSVNTIDARLAIHDVFESGVDLAIYGKNLSDQVACGANPLVSGALTVTCTDPRTFGGEVLYRFGSNRQ
jgi:hypothetical protein